MGIGWSQLLSTHLRRGLGTPEQLNEEFDSCMHAFVMLALIATEDRRSSSHARLLFSHASGMHKALSLLDV